MNIRLTYILTLFFTFSVKLFAQDENKWSSPQTIYQEGAGDHLQRVQVTYKLSVCKNGGKGIGKFLLGYSFVRIKNEFARKGDMISFNLKFLDCDDKERVSNFFFKLDTYGVIESMGDWFMGYKVLGITDIKYKSTGEKQDGSANNKPSNSGFGQTHTGISQPPKEINFPKSKNLSLYKSMGDNYRQMAENTACNNRKQYILQLASYCDCLTENNGNSSFCKRPTGAEPKCAQDDNTVNLTEDIALLDELVKSEGFKENVQPKYRMERAPVTNPQPTYYPPQTNKIKKLPANEVNKILYYLRAGDEEMYFFTKGANDAIAIWTDLENFNNPPLQKLVWDSLFGMYNQLLQKALKVSEVKNKDEKQPLYLDYFGNLKQLRREFYKTLIEGDPPGDNYIESSMWVYFMAFPKDFTEKNSYKMFFTNSMRIVKNKDGTWPTMEQMRKSFIENIEDMAPENIYDFKVRSYFSTQFLTNADINKMKALTNNLGGKYQTVNFNWIQQKARPKKSFWD